MKPQHISQSQLESYLWGAATLLRGYIDAGDYKQCIFALLFCKRLCDVYSEELADALEESGGDQEYAVIDYRDQTVGGVSLKLDSDIGLLSDEEILDRHNQILLIRKQSIANYVYEAIEIPPDRPQVEYA